MPWDLVVPRGLGVFCVALFFWENRSHWENPPRWGCLTWWGLLGGRSCMVSLHHSPPSSSLLPCCSGVYYTSPPPSLSLHLPTPSLSFVGCDTPTPSYYALFFFSRVVLFSSFCLLFPYIFFYFNFLPFLSSPPFSVSFGFSGVVWYRGLSTGCAYVRSDRMGFIPYVIILILLFDVALVFNIVHWLALGFNVVHWLLCSCSCFAVLFSFVCIVLIHTKRSVVFEGC